MQLSSRLPLVIFSSLALSVAVMHAQDDDEDDEQFGIFSRSKQSLSVGLKLTQGPHVQFGSLGNVSRPIERTDNGIVRREYSNGKVFKDGKRAAELAIDALSDTDPKKALARDEFNYRTYSTSADPSSTLTGTFLNYKSGIARDWEYYEAGQANRPGHGGTIAFDSYSALTKNEPTREGSRGYSGGIELFATHQLTDPRKRISFSIIAGVSLTGINSSSTGQVNSNLIVATDYYRFIGTDVPVFTGSDVTPGVIYQGRQIVTAVASDGTSISTEVTRTIEDSPSASDDPKAVGSVVVDGKWKIKGAYFTFRVGPQVQAMLTKSISLSASIGLAGSYVGTTFSAEESFKVPGKDLPNTTDPTDETSTENKFLSGYYANLDANWELTGRTGFFAGVSYEKSGDYTQGVGGRSARIDLSTTTGFRGGINIKF